ASIGENWVSYVRPPGALSFVPAGVQFIAHARSDFELVACALDPAIVNRIGIEVGADDFLNKPVGREQLMARGRSLLRLKAFTDELEGAEAVLYALARSIEGKDPYTLGHCERLAELSAQLGERMVLSAEEVKALRRAGIVHDIGKVAVPDSILLKPG